MSRGIGLLPSQSSVRRGRGPSHAVLQINAAFSRLASNAELKRFLSCYDAGINRKSVGMGKGLILWLMGVPGIVVIGLLVLHIL